MDAFRLSSALPGDTLRIKELLFPTSICRRFMDMGLFPGTIVNCLLYAPSGSPVLLEVKGFRLALRRCDCDQIMVNICDQH